MFSHWTSTQNPSIWKLNETPKKSLKEIPPYIVSRKWQRGVRLKDEISSENQTHQQSNQLQHPQQTIHTEKLLKETSTNNNIEYTIMDTSQQLVLDYLLSSEQGEILKRNGQELKKLKMERRPTTLKGGNPFQRGWLPSSTRLSRLWTTKSMNWKRREALDGSILTRTKHSQASKWDTKQPPPTNSLLSKISMVMSICMPSPTSGLEASKHYNIWNTKIWDWKSIWGNITEWRWCYKSSPLWRAKRPMKM